MFAIKHEKKQNDTVFIVLCPLFTMYSDVRQRCTGLHSLELCHIPSKFAFRQKMESKDLERSTIFPLKCDKQSVSLKKTAFIKILILLKVSFYMCF